jgi:hypothetical protein
MQKHVQRTKPELHSLAAINGGNVVENQQICLGMMGILEHLEALEPADVYERDKRVFLFKLWLDQNVRIP